MLKIEIKFSATTFDGKNLISEEQKNYWSQMINSLIYNIKDKINISNLKSIIIPESYGDELFQYQKKVGAIPGYTNNDTGRGFAQVLTQILDNRMAYTIFFDKEVIFPLVDNATYHDMGNSLDGGKFKILESTRNTSINIFYHELAHIEEMNVSEKIIWLNNLNFDQNELKYQIRELALAIWREYYACRTSSFAHDLNNSDTVYILELCKKVESEILSKRKSYNLTLTKIDEFVPLLHQKVNSLFKFSAYAHGNYFCISLQEDRNKIINAVREGLEGTLFYEYWLQLGIILNDLYIHFPEWGTINVINGLCNIIIGYIEKFNIHISNQPEGLYYDIPIDPDLL